MSRYPLKLLLLLTALLSGCVKPQIPVVPETLRQPVPVPTGPVHTTGQLAKRTIDLTAAVQTANDRIVAVDCILDAAEAGRVPECD